MAQVGGAAPAFDLLCTNVPGHWRVRRTLGDYAGGWLLVLFYPQDFSFACPTELRDFSARASEFSERECSILAVGADSIELHEEWLAAQPQLGGLGPIAFPLASDCDSAVSRNYGVCDPQGRAVSRGLFFVDPSGNLQYKVVHNLCLGRTVDEALRVLDALRSGAPCSASWALGDGTIDEAQVPGPGLLLGHYRLQERLGEGGFGLVLKAWDLWLHRVVALKVLRPGGRLDRERVLVEARPAARLSHPNICTVYSVEIQDGLPVIAMEYLSGETLAVRLRRGALTPQSARIIGGYVARAMAASHAIGVVHGDLKPGNIMVTDDGWVKVVDFGLASVVTPGEADDEAVVAEAALAEDWANEWPSVPPGPASAGRRSWPSAPPPSARGVCAPSSAPASAHGPRSSRPSSRCSSPPKRASVPGPLAAQPVAPAAVPIFRGTPQYMSPEHGTAAGPTDASDVFSFGLVLYEMLTGSRALPGKTLRSAMRRVRGEDLSLLGDDVPKPSRNVVRACLRRDPADRPTMADVERWLARG